MIVNIPRSIQLFKQNNRKQWNELMNHEFVNNVLFGNYYKSEPRQWFNFIIQERFSINLINQAIKKNNGKLIIDDRYKKPNEKAWERYKINKLQVVESDVTRITQEYCSDILNNSPRNLNLSLLVNIISAAEICKDNEYYLHKLILEEYDMFDSMHDKVLDSKEQYVQSFSGKLNVLDKLRKCYGLNTVFNDMYKSDQYVIYESVERRIEFLDQFV